MSHQLAANERPPKVVNDINGILLVDKPSEITSAGVVRYLKHRLHPKKIGHGGTLDPLGTGLLVILLGKATKLSDTFLLGDKVYQGTFRLGLGTTTDDIEGEVLVDDPEVENRFPPERREALEKDLERTFTGTLEQIPPQVSAIKVDGKRSYDLARQGKAVNLQPRKVEIRELDLKFLSANRMSYRMRCSKGTYVRSLARDLGVHLGTSACVELLRREEVGSLHLAKALPMESISMETYHQAFIPIETFPRV